MESRLPFLQSGNDVANPFLRGASACAIVVVLALFFRILIAPPTPPQNPQTPAGTRHLQAKNGFVGRIDLYYADPEPQSIDWSPMEVPDDDLLVGAPKIWAVLMGESPGQEEVNKLQRVFSQRRIEILYRGHEKRFMACIRFESREEARWELEDLQQHQSDLDQFDLHPRVINLSNYLSASDIP